MLSVLVICAGLAPGLVSAATITVDEFSDGSIADLAGDGYCSLREAVESANRDEMIDSCAAGDSNEADTILFDFSEPDHEIVLRDGPIELRSDMRIVSEGDDAGRPRLVIDADEHSRILSVTDARVTVEYLVLENGREQIEDEFWMTGGEGGAILLSGPAGHLTVKSAVLRDNAAFSGTAIAAVDFGSLQLEAVTITGNRRVGPGGLATVYLNGGQDAEFRNTTIAGNDSRSSVSILAYELTGGVDLHHVAIAGNGGAGLTVSEDEGFDGPIAVRITNSVIDEPEGSDCFLGGTGLATIDFADYPGVTARGNHFSDVTCVGRADGPSGLGAPGDHGGAGVTLLPQPGSPLLGRGHPDECLGSDARGRPRASRDGGRGCDVGPVEVLPTVVSWDAPSESVREVSEADGEISIRLRREGDWAQALDVHVSAGAAGDSAVARSDYAFDAGAIRFGEAEHTRPVTLHVLDDDLGEALELLTLNLRHVAVVQGGGSARIGEPSERRVLIAPSDHAIRAWPLGELSTTEDGGSDRFQVALAAPPAAGRVTLKLQERPVPGRSPEVRVEPAALVFDTSDWSSPRTVTITGRDDRIDDGDRAYDVDITVDRSQTGANEYTAVGPVTVSGVNRDNNDRYGLGVQPAGGLETTEGGGIARFSVALNAPPSDDVMLEVSVTDASEGVIEEGRLVFTPRNWSVPREVTVRGRDDFVDDGDQVYTVSVVVVEGASPHEYQGVAPRTITVTNIDDDGVYGVTVLPDGELTTTESGGQARFSVVLDAQPSGQVVIPVASSDTGEGTVSETGLAFTPEDWNVPRTVTVTGVTDEVVDLATAYRIRLGPAKGAQYDGMEVPDVRVVNHDTVIPYAIHVRPDEPLITDESGKTATFEVALGAPPGGTIRMPVRVSDATEGAVDVEVLTFGPNDWDRPRMVTVTGVQDDILDGTQGYTIMLGPVEASTPGDPYAGRDPRDVLVLNASDDAAFEITVVAEGELETSEAGAVDHFAVVLDAPPSSDVHLPITVSEPGEAAVEPAVLTFTPSSWRVPQLVTVHGVDDEVYDGNAVYEVRIGPAEGAPEYAAADPIALSGSNADDEVAGDDPTSDRDRGRDWPSGKGPWGRDAGDRGASGQGIREEGGGGGGSLGVLVLLAGLAAWRGRRRPEGAVSA
jgi:hypothetical protein